MNQHIMHAVNHLNTKKIVADAVSPLLSRITELEAQLEATKWQPIETAPKDGTEILVLFKRLGVKCVAWTTRWNDPTDEHAHWHIDDCKHDPYPLRGYNEEDEIGWMPLPRPPMEVKPLFGELIDKHFPEGIDAAIQTEGEA